MGCVGDCKIERKKTVFVAFSDFGRSPHSSGGSLIYWVSCPLAHNSDSGNQKTKREAQSTDCGGRCGCGVVPEGAYLEVMYNLFITPLLA